jgi:hypothetical protein
MLSALNNEQTNVDEGGIVGLSHKLGKSRLFVDVGSRLGYTSMAVAILHPGTGIVSIEAAATNWLLQQMNWHCNDFDGGGDDENENVENPTTKRLVLMSGVGPSTGSSQMAKFVWRPRETTSTRAWKEDPKKVDDLETNPDESGAIELNFKLRPWHSIQTEDEITN